MAIMARLGILHLKNFKHFWPLQVGHFDRSKKGFWETTISSQLKLTNTNLKSLTTVPKFQNSITRIRSRFYKN
jgi:hypothetical protein